MEHSLFTTLAFPASLSFEAFLSMSAETSVPFLPPAVPHQPFYPKLFVASAALSPLALAPVRSASDFPNQEGD